jgi:hypothetical protein
MWSDTNQIKLALQNLMITLSNTFNRDPSVAPEMKRVDEQIDG